MQILAERNAKIKELMVKHYGDEIAPTIDAWIAGTEKLEKEIYESMEQFRASLKGVTDLEARHAMWEEVYSTA